MDSSLQALINATKEAARGKNAAPDESRIHVSEVFTAAASLYEWLRNRLEFKEEHMLRRSAIERILKRALLFGIGNARERSEEMLRELVRSAYFPNDFIPWSNIDPLSSILSRYRAFIQALEGRNEKLTPFFIQLASVEIEHLLVTTEKLVEEAFMEFAYSRLRTHIEWRNTRSGSEHETQLFIALFRTVLHADDPTIAWVLFGLIRPEFQHLSDQGVHPRLNEFTDAARAVQAQLRHPSYRFYARSVRQFVPALTILHDMLMTKTASFGDIVSDPARCRDVAARAAQARTEAVGERVSRMAVWATIYVFLTKMLIAFAIELPLEARLSGFRFMPLLANLAFPPLAMFVIAKTTFVPREENVRKISQNVQEMLYPENSMSPWRAISVLPRPNLVKDIIFWVTSVVLFGGLGWWLARSLSSLGFSPLGVGVFFFFLATVSFFAWRIRQPARDITAITPRENFFTAALETFLFPFMVIGRLISDGLTKINIPLMFFDLAIEAPIKVLLNFFEDWLRFLREKREELIE